MKTLKFAAVLASAYASFPVIAADAAGRTETNRTETAELPPVVVEASRIDSTAEEMPQRVEIVTRERIAASGARDVVDALARCTGVFVRHLGGGNPALTDVSLRGYGENSSGRVRVTVDGEALNNPDMSTADFSRIPLDAVERIEVLPGPQTVMHGGSASAGLINIVTEKKDYSKRTSAEIHAGSWGTVGGSLGTRGGDEDAMIAYWANGSWDHSDGYRSNSRFDLWRANGGLRKDFENGSWLKLSSFWSDTQYELPGPLSRGVWEDRPRDANPYYRIYDYWRTSYGLNFSGLGKIDDDNALKFVFTYSYRRDQFTSLYFRDYGGGSVTAYNQHSPFSSYSLSFLPQYINTSRIGSFDNEFTLGGDLRWDLRRGRNSYSYPTYVWQQKEDQSRWTMGGFARDEFFLLDELSVFAGARLERAMTRSKSLDNPSRNDNLAAGEAGVIYRPVEEAKLFAKWSHFYRLPFVDETGYASGNVVSPEQGWSVDVGGDWKFLDDFTVGGVLYVSETEDEIYYDPYRFDNFNLPGNVRREGFDVNFGWEREKVAGVCLRYGWVNAEIKDGDYDGYRVPAVPRQQLSLDGHVYVWSEFFVRGGFRYVGEQYSISDFRNSAGELDGYGLFSVGCQYQPEWRWLKGFTFSFDVDNLFDKTYCDYSTYGENFWPGAGRSYMFKIAYSF